MFPAGYLNIGTPSPSPLEMERIAGLKAIINRPKAPAKTKVAASRKPVASGNEKLSRRQIAQLCGKTFKGSGYAFGRTVFIK